jgi:alkylhydroperoxidase family enzyme
MACHAEFLRVALHDAAVSRAVLDRPHELTLPPRAAALAEITATVTQAPWSLTADHRTRAHAAGLDDEDLLHAIALSAFFGHLNRIADAVDIALDYEVAIQPPGIDRARPDMSTAPRARVGRPALDLATRPETAKALSAWRTYAFERDAPLSRRHRTLIVRWVARWLGDGTISSPDDLTANPLDQSLRELAEALTLAPWAIGPSLDRLRAQGFDDRALFDACTTTSTAGMFSRLEVALVALAAQPDA